MIPCATPPPHRLRAFTLLEVMLSMLMVCIALGGILSLNTKSVHTLRAARQTAAASQVLQQRVEAIRGKPWPEVSNSTALAAFMGTGTESEKELAGAAPEEILTVSPGQPSVAGPVAGAGGFRVRREDGVATIEQPGDLGTEHTIIIESSIEWTDAMGPHMRTLKTLVCRAGLTRSGIFGSDLGR